MEKFLKKYSTVPNGFITDFFNIVNESYNDNDLIIDFDIVVKWLHVRKDNLKHLMVKNFTENFDYIITKVKQKHENSNGANYYEDIKITPDCFKELCMLSQTAKAKEVRRYYLSIEKLVKKYNQYIQEKLYKINNALEINQKPKININGGILYFFKVSNQDDICDNDEIIEILLKIGRTNNKKKRFQAYNTGNADDVEPLFILEVDDIVKTEKCIKNLIGDFQYRKKKEIYKITIDILKEVFGKCDELVHGFKKYIKNTDQKTVNKSFKNMRHSNNGIYLVFAPNN